MPNSRLTPSGSKPIIGPEASLARPAGEPNETRIVVRDGTVEHWLNGALAVSYEWRSPEALDAIGASKFAGSAGFMAADEGRIVLQHHGEEVWYDGARIRALGP